MKVWERRDGGFKTRVSRLSIDQEVDKMLRVPAIIQPRLISLVTSEIERLMEIHTEVGDDWPEDFDANDIPLYDVILTELILSQSSKSLEIDLGPSKLNRFLTMIIPRYVINNRDCLSVEEYNALGEVYAQWPLTNMAFPE